MYQEEDEFTRRVIQGAIRVHRALGPGLLEVAYRTCLARELRLSGFRVDTEVPLPLSYRGQRVECGFRIDLIVDRELILEIKAVRDLHPIHSAQVLTYLRLSGIRLGLLLNFHALLLTSGIRRIVSDPSSRSLSAAEPHRPP